MHRFLHLRVGIPTRVTPVSSITEHGDEPAWFSRLERGCLMIILRIERLLVLLSIAIDFTFGADGVANRNFSDPLFYSVEIVVQKQNKGHGQINTVGDVEAASLSFSSVQSPELVASSFCWLHSCSGNQEVQVANLVSTIQAERQQKWLCRDSDFPSFSFPNAGHTQLELVRSTAQLGTERREEGSEEGRGGQKDSLQVPSEEDVKAFCSRVKCTNTSEHQLLTSFESLSSSASKKLTGDELRSAVKQAKTQALFPECSRSFWRRHFARQPFWSSDSTLSVVVPARNAEDSIAAAMRSVNESAFRFCSSLRSSAPHAPSPNTADANAKKIGQCPVELVVVDDASEDSTLSRAEAVVLQCTRKRSEGERKVGIEGGGCEAWLDVVIVQVKRRYGAGGARNVGVQQSRGSSLLFLDADDVFLPRHISVLTGALQHVPTAIGARSQVQLWDSERDSSIRGVTARWKAAVDNGAPTNLVISRDVHKCVRGYPSGLSVGEDFIYAQRLLALSSHLALPLLRVPFETVRYHRRPGNSLDRQREKFSVDTEDG